MENIWSDEKIKQWLRLMKQFWEFSTVYFRKSEFFQIWVFPVLKADLFRYRYK